LPRLPVAEELVLFNRSWYKRASVEYVMVFGSKNAHENFLQSARKFEAMLVYSGIKLMKFYLDTRHPQGQAGAPVGRSGAWSTETV